MIFTISRNMYVYARALIGKKIDLTDLDPNEFTSIRGLPDAYWILGEGRVKIVRLRTHSSNQFSAYGPI